jgi:hypothetical protein
LDELDATILPKVEGEEARTFVVTVQRMYPFYDHTTQTHKLSVDLIADDDIHQADVNQVDQYSCRHCHRLLSNNVQCYVFRGEELKKGEDDDMPDGAVMVVTVGRFARFDIPTIDDIRDAISELVEFSVPDGQGRIQDPARTFEW